MKGKNVGSSGVANVSLGSLIQGFKSQGAYRGSIGSPLIRTDRDSRIKSTYYQEEDHSLKKVTALTDEFCRTLTQQYARVGKKHVKETALDPLRDILMRVVSEENEVIRTALKKPTTYFERASTSFYDTKTWGEFLDKATSDCLEDRTALARL